MASIRRLWPTRDPPPPPPSRPTPPRHWTDVLGVRVWTPDDEVAKAYRLLALRHHPDRGGDPAEMRRVNDAYDRFKRDRGIK